MFTLITNLSYVFVNGIRTNCDALVIVPPKDGSDSFIDAKTVHLRGFGPDAAWPVFDMHLQTADPSFELEGMESSILFIGDDENGESKDPKPLFTGGKLTFTDGTQLQLVKQLFNTEAIDFEQIETDDYETLWHTLAVKAAKYTGSPAMPILQHLPVADVQWLHSRGRDMVRQLSAITGQNVQQLKAAMGDRMLSDLN